MGHINRPQRFRISTHFSLSRHVRMRLTASDTKHMYINLHFISCINKRIHSKKKMVYLMMENGFDVFVTYISKT